MATKAPSRAIKLFGTTNIDSKGRVLRAGPLSAVLDNGQLRYIRVNDIEVLRAIAFLVRDENWGTFTPEITNLKVKQGKTGFRVTYRARCADAKRALTYDAEITGDVADGLKFSAKATPESDFLTNRTGFVVLHPLQGVAGKPVKVMHVDGRSEKSRFPKIINPVQPFYNIHALSHEIAPGNWAICRMEGDSFEMEDHRNWTDASFKTYVRPLAEPWPYTLPAGKSFDQAVSLTFTRKLPKPKGRGGSKKISVTLGGGAGTMPRIGVGVPAEEADNAISAADALKAAGLQQLICQIDCRRGDATALCRRYKQLGDATGAGVVLEIILTGTESPDAELARVGGQAKVAGLQPMAVAVSPAPDLKATLPGSAGPKVAPLADIYKAARAAFPGVRLGGGMFSYFTELNRKRPPVELLDYVTHTNAPIVHAADDISVMETLEALPYVIDFHALLHRQEDALLGRAQQHRRPRQSLWRGDGGEPGQPAHLPGGPGSQASRPVRRRLDSRLRRRLRPRRRRGGEPRRGDRPARPALPADRYAAALLRRGEARLLSAVSRDRRVGRCGGQEADRRRQRRADQGGQPRLPRCRRPGCLAGQSHGREADRAGQGVQAGTGGHRHNRRGKLRRGNEAAGLPRQADQESEEGSGIDPAAALRGRAHRRGVLTSR